MSIKQNIEELLRPVVEDLGYELIGVEHNAHASSGVLRLYIDEPQRGIGLEDCARVSREVSATLDVHDPIRGNYNLEVSSPGLDRPLFSAAQFSQFVGEPVRVTLNAPVQGRRKFAGDITAVNENVITLSVEGEMVEFNFDDVVKARLVPNV